MPGLPETGKSVVNVLLLNTRAMRVTAHLAGRRQLLFLTNCSDDSKLYMICVALIKGFQNHTGFPIIRASCED